MKLISEEMIEAANAKIIPSYGNRMVISGGTCEGKVFHINVGQQPLTHVDHSNFELREIAKKAKEAWGEDVSIFYMGECLTT